MTMAMAEAAMEDYNTVSQSLEYYMGRCGEDKDAPLFIFRDKDGGRKVFTFDRLHRLAGRCAAFFRAKGVEKGTRVLVCLKNSPERLVCEFGLLYAGAVCVNGLHEILDGSDVIHCLRHSQARVILLNPDSRDSPWIPLQKIVQRAEDGTATSEKLPELQHVQFVQRGSSGSSGTDFLTLLDTSSEWFFEEGTRHSDDCFVFTTSGTSGFPKMTLHSHDHFVSSMKQWDRLMKTTGGPRQARYHDSPLGTSGGNVTCTLMLKETRVLCDFWTGVPEDRVGFVARCIREEKCSKAALLPVDILTIHRRVNGLRDASSAKSEGKNHHNHNNNNSYNNSYNNDNGLALIWDDPLVQISIGGQPVTSKAVDAALDLAQTVLVYYGNTELGVISAALVKEKGCYQDYSVGHAVPGVSFKVIDERTEEELPVGQIGQVLIHHPSPFIDYLSDPNNDPNDPSMTRRCDMFTDSGYYKTGDRGKLNSDNSLSVFGRTGDATIMKGMWVYYPHVIEAVIRECSGISDVIVVGVPHKEMTEEFCACVVLEEGASLTEMEMEVKTKFAGPDVTPGCLWPRFYLQFESLPRLYTGRHNRRLIKESARKRLLSE